MWHIAFFLILKMEAIYTSNTLVSVSKTTGRHILERSKPDAHLY
jgi:hypothetical protein